MPIIYNSGGGGGGGPPSGAAGGDLAGTYPNPTVDNVDPTVIAAGTAGIDISGNAATATSIAVGGITGLGTGVAAALAINVGTAGTFVVNGGALGTPASGVLTNCTGLPAASVVAGTFGAGNYVITPVADSGATVTINALAGTPRVSLGTLVGLTTYGAIYGNVTPSVTNYTLATNGTNTLVNTSAGYVALTVGGVNYFAVLSGQVAAVAHTTLGLNASPHTQLSNSTDVILTRVAAGTLGLGYTHATTPTAQIIKSHNVTTGTGASLTLCGGTGSVAGGALAFATSVTTGAAVNHLTIAANGDIVIATDAARKVAFYGGTPVVQGGSITDASVSHNVTGGDLVSQSGVESALNAIGATINEIIDRITNINIIAP